MARSRQHSPRNAENLECRWARERLEAYWGFDLPMAEFVRVEEHLGACPACAAAFEALRPRLEAEAIAVFGMDDMKPAAELARDIIQREAAGELVSRWLSGDELARMADEIEAEIEEAYAGLQFNLSDFSSDDGQDCFWVQENLGAYDLWDDSLSRAEFGAIERHLQQCPACASEFADIRRARQTIEMTVAGVGRDAWEQEKKEFSAKILARLRDTGIFDGEVATSPTVVPLAAPRFHLYEPAEPRQDDTWQEPRRGKRLLVMAVSLLLMFALPVLALVVVREFLPASKATEFSAESHDDRTTTNMQLPPMPHQGSDCPSVEKAAPNLGALNEAIVATDMLDADAEAKLRDFELAVLLANTEEEYEAWARKEYPHVMGLYDILTQVDENDPNAVPLWDGVPVNIPAWGMRLYEDTPSDERPMGWRALLIYSGEIFKFDWPTNLAEECCKPTDEALQRAAAVAGRFLKLSGNDDHGVPHLLGRDGSRVGIQNIATESGTVDWGFSLQDMPDSYVASLVRDVPLFTSALRYFVRSSNLVQVPLLDGITQEASKLLCGELLDSTIPECNVRARLLSFIDLLDTRRDLLRRLEW